MSAADKILEEAVLKEVLESHRRAGRRIVFSNGGFDLLHVGHVRVLEEAAELGGVLVVAVNDDPSVRVAKGPGRPVVPARERAEVVAALQAVDYVVVFPDATVDRLLRELRPHVHVKGRDYTPDTIPERATHRELGIEVAILGDPKLHSTTQLLARASAVRDAADRVAPLRLPGGGRGLVNRRAWALLARAGWIDLARLATTEEGALVQRHRGRTVRRLEIEGTAAYLKVNRPADRRRRPPLELQNHLALRAAGFRAPEPWLALEGTVGGEEVAALLTREAPGLRLDEYLALALAESPPRDRHAIARGIGATLRALHTARFYPLDLQAWHVLVEGSATGGRRAISFLDLMRVARRPGLARRHAVQGLAALCLSVRDIAPPRFLLAALRAYLGGTLRGARWWLARVRGRMARLEHRSTFRDAAAAAHASVGGAGRPGGPGPGGR